MTTLNPETQKGFSLALMAASPEYDLAELEEEFIQDYIRSNLEGRFDFVLWRDADSSDSEDE